MNILNVRKALVNGGLNGRDTIELSHFAAAHPGVVGDIERNPALLNDPAFMAKHGNLEKFLATHPGAFAAERAAYGRHIPGGYPARPLGPGEAIAHPGYGGAVVVPGETAEHHHHHHGEHENLSKHEYPVNNAYVPPGHPVGNAYVPSGHPEEHKGDRHHHGDEEHGQGVRE